MGATDQNLKLLLAVMHPRSMPSLVTSQSYMYSQYRGTSLISPLPPTLCTIHSHYLCTFQ